ncbi:hypothetical protein [Flammeovirga sp. SubArs3]|nr:hypothetical protein [Flammeovirga sp. SubArs3]
MKFQELELNEVRQIQGGFWVIRAVTYGLILSSFIQGFRDGVESTK